MSREDFIERAAVKAVEKITEKAEKKEKLASGTYPVGGLQGDAFRHVGRIAWENRVLERHYQQDEASEEALVNGVIKAEVGNNFQLFSMWACRFGLKEALRRQRDYEDKLQKERERLVRVKVLRKEQGLRSRDVVDRIRSHRQIDTVTDRFMDLKISVPAPKSTKS